MNTLILFLVGIAILILIIKIIIKMVKLVTWVMALCMLFAMTYGYGKLHAQPQQKIMPTHKNLKK